MNSSVQLKRWHPVNSPNAPYSPLLFGFKKIFLLLPFPAWGGGGGGPSINGMAWRQYLFRAQELCESRGGSPGLSVLMSLTVSVDVKQH